MLGRNQKDLITVKDVPASEFITAYAEHLKKTQKVLPMKNSHFIKTGHYKKVSPYNEDWFYMRAATLARMVYLRPEIGISTLRNVFGGRENNGNANYHHALASGKVLRYALQQLEDANVLMRLNDQRNKNNQTLPDKKSKLLPRVITPEGQKEVNEIAKQVFIAKYSH